MGKINDLILHYTYKKEDRLEEFEQYKRQVKAIENNIDMYSKNVDNAIKEFKEIQKRFPEGSKEYISAKDEVSKWEYSLEENRLQLKFMRPNSNEDIEYRESISGDEFSKKLMKVMPKELDLRFHGTPIYFAEQIIKNKQISSTADRNDGYIKSTDMEGEISASTPETIGRTIDFFSDIPAYQRCLPAGCIFALLPKSEDNDELKKMSIMHSVDFNKNPEQLFGIFTTPENIERVKGWMKEANLDQSIVHTFEDFIQLLEEKSRIIDEQNEL